MKNRIFRILVIVLLVFCTKSVLASELCSSNGYTILTINGIFTDERGAQENKKALEGKLIKTFNNQPLKVDFLYNPTHLLGVGDIFDAVAQGVFDQKSDYDLVEMLNDASQKINTQKLLLVAHSQGNFYANSFYDKVASKPGGVPIQSIGIYGVGTPANHVAGGGKYLTSDTDKVIATVVGRFLNILPPNIHIPLQPIDGNGHSFSDVYIKYQGNRIISDIKSSLDKLQNNDEQLSTDPCISAPELTTLHKIQGVVLASADFTIDNTKKAAVYVADGAYNIGAFIGKNIRSTGIAINNLFNNLSANVVEGVPDIASLTTLPIGSRESEEETTPNTLEGKSTETDVKTDTKDGEVLSPEVLSPETKEEKKKEEKTITLETIPNPEIPIPLPNLLPGTGGTVDITPLDTTLPVITILGTNPVEIIKNSSYVDAGATATDDKDATVTVVATGIENVNTSIVGIYTITYDTTDSAGNHSSLTRTVNVIEDPSPPLGDPPPVIDEGAKLDSPNFVTVSGNYAYVVSQNSNSLEIIDISNPMTLVHKSYLLHVMEGPVLFSPKAVAVSQNYAYVISGSNALEIIDVSNPLLPLHKSMLRNGEGGVALNNPSSIAISQNYAYIVSSSGSSLEIVDISNPLVPLHKGVFYGNGFSSLARPSSISISGDYVYIVSNTSDDLEIINISDPIHPTLVSVLYNGNGVSLNGPASIFVSQNYAYVASRGDKTFEILNVSNPANPTHLAKLNSGFGNQDNFTPNFVTVSGNYAYITSWVGETLEIVDISDPANPIHKASLANGVGGAALSYPSSVFVSGNYAYVSSNISNALEVVDVTDPTHPFHKNKILNGEYNHTDPVLSSAKQINTFNFDSLNPNVVGVVDEMAHTISLNVPFGTTVTALVPTITISERASINPNNNLAQDFTNPVTYTVTAQNGFTQNYIVTVVIAPDPNPPPPLPDIIPPSITSYTFNGVVGDITINPTSPNPLSLIFNASENVNWMSIKIEKEDDASVYKNFQSGAGCVDGTNTCTKSWDGTLSRGGLLQNGTYRIKIHIKDVALNEFYDYITPYKITINTSL